MTTKPPKHEGTGPYVVWCREANRYRRISTPGHNYGDDECWTDNPLEAWRTDKSPDYWAYTQCCEGRDVLQLLLTTDARKWLQGVTTDEEEEED